MNSAIKNRDILVSFMSITLAGAIGMIANAFRFLAYADRERRGGRGALFIALLMPIAASIIHLGIPRSREYMADRSSAFVCKNPLALASALLKLQQSVETQRIIPRSGVQATTASLFIAYPFSSKYFFSTLTNAPPYGRADRPPKRDCKKN